MTKGGMLYSEKAKRTQVCCPLKRAEALRIRRVGNARCRADEVCDWYDSGPSWDEPT